LLREHFVEKISHVATTNEMLSTSANNDSEDFCQVAINKLIGVKLCNQYAGGSTILTQHNFQRHFLETCFFRTENLDFLQNFEQYFTQFYMYTDKL